MSKKNKNQFNCQKNIINKIFNPEQFKHIGITEVKYQTRYLQKLSFELFYLQNNIVKILMPYIIKVENQIKAACFKDDSKSNKAVSAMSLKDAINIISKKPHVYINDTSMPLKNKIAKTDPEQVILNLLDAFRICRNITMHGDPQFLGYFLTSRDVKETMFKMMAQRHSFEDFRKWFGKIKNIKSIFHSSGKTDETLSYLLIILFTIKIFNHPKIFNKIVAEIDYSIYVFRTSTNISTSEALWHALGLKEDWVKKII